MAGEIGEAYVRIAARDADLQTGLARAEQSTRGAMGQIQTVSNTTMTNMGYVGRRELILLSSQFGVTGIAAQRMFMLIQAQSEVIAASLARLTPLLLAVGVAIASWEIFKGIDALMAKLSGRAELEKEIAKEVEKTTRIREKSDEKLKTDQEKIIAGAEELVHLSGEEITNRVAVAREIGKIKWEWTRGLTVEQAIREVMEKEHDIRSEQREDEERTKRFNESILAFKERELAEERSMQEQIEKARDDEVKEKIKNQWEEWNAIRDKHEREREERKTAKEEEMDELTRYLHESSEREKRTLDDKMYNLEKEMRGVHEKHDDKIRLLEEEERKRKRIRFDILGGPKEVWEAAVKSGVSTRDLEEKRYSLEKTLSEDIRALTKELEKAREQERQLNRIPF